MSETATIEPSASTLSRQDAGDRAAETASFLPRSWSSNLQAGAETARAIQTENAELAQRILQLAGAPMQSPLDMGASAFELYLGYLGRCAALSQQAIVLPWWEAGRVNGRRRS